MMDEDDLLCECADACTGEASVAWWKFLFFAWLFLS